MAADIDCALDAARAQIAARNDVYARFTAAGRDLALADQELADARASADKPVARSRWRRRRGGDEPAAGPDVAALRSRVEQLRADRSRLEAEYRSLGDPTATYAELLERKCELLAGEAGPAGDELRRLEAEAATLGALLARLEAAIADGEAAEQCVRELREELLEAVKDRKQLGAVGGALGGALAGGVARAAASAAARHLAGRAGAGTAGELVAAIERFNVSLGAVGQDALPVPAADELRQIPGAERTLDAVVEPLRRARQRLVETNAAIARTKQDRRTLAETARLRAD